MALSAVFVVGSVVAAVRLGPDVWGAVPWAEDAQVFLQQAAASRTGLGPLLTSYNGYLHLLPRLVAAAARLLPLTAAATTLLVACALLQGFAAALTWHVLRANGVSRPAALVAALPVVMVPVGVEVVLSLANMQWFLLYLGMLMTIWSPRTWGGRAVQSAVVVVTALSSPFGAVPAGILLVRAVVRRSRPELVAAGPGALAAAAQLVAIRLSPPRPLHATLDPLSLGEVYLRRVVADGLMGVAHDGSSKDAPDILLGAICVAIVLVLAAVAIRRRGSRPAVLAGSLLGLSLLAFVAPAVLEGVVGVDPGFAGRYYVAPALLWTALTAVVLSYAFQPPIRHPRLVMVGAGALAAGFVAALVLSYPVRIAGREGVPAWSAQVASVLTTCETGSADPVTILVAPTGSTVALGCDEVERW